MFKPSCRQILRPGCFGGRTRAGRGRQTLLFVVVAQARAGSKGIPCHADARRDAGAARENMLQASRRRPAPRLMRWRGPHSRVACTRRHRSARRPSFPQFIGFLAQVNAQQQRKNLV